MIYVCAALAIVAEAPGIFGHSCCERVPLVPHRSRTPDQLVRAVSYSTEMVDVNASLAIQKLLNDCKIWAHSIPAQ
ncbi:uncharacterized protein B0H18DRAFT_556237 [Fomitopsis serialis]|uniref:uncharacterized protein n=1 Tax=Fomitopsis serialis TaxID=139415 RepID=UPI0020075532|nr:uncharacterized protein B0H18DRAFT_556237 [Neoantrodia serialis]KAH9934345.1 hypothetical protein B0H18DRAFT_556237 [Neoantrodia serialis]